MVPFIAARVTGGVVLLLFGLVCIFWARRKHNEQKRGEDDDNENVEMENQDDCEDGDPDDYENADV